jgi:hypothetical protein
MDMDRIDQAVTVNTTEVWEVATAQGTRTTSTSTTSSSRSSSHPARRRAAPPHQHHQ